MCFYGHCVVCCVDCYIQMIGNTGDISVLAMFCLKCPSGCKMVKPANF